jgi:opacity protein-like surface antigen
VYRAAAVAIAALAVALSSGAAAADPVAPQVNTPCPPDAAGAATRPADAKMPLVCSSGSWQAVTTPQPPNDRWLSVGPPMLLHGEGRQNPDVQSGDWTATPRTADTRCRAEQTTVLEPGVLTAPDVAEGSADQRLQVTFAPRLFNVTLSGDCLWARRD